MRVLIVIAVLFMISSCSSMSLEIMDTRENSFQGRNGDVTGKINTDASLSKSESLVRIDSNEFIVAGNFADRDILSIYLAMPDKIRSKISFINQFKTYQDIKAEYNLIYGTKFPADFIESLILHHGVMVFVDIGRQTTHVYRAKKVKGAWVVELSYRTVS